MPAAFAMTASFIYLAGTLGIDGVVTGKVATTALMIAIIVYACMSVIWRKR